jgi:hypothetical protein
VFGGALKPDRIRILAHPAPWPDRPFVPGWVFGRLWMVYTAASALADFSVGSLSRQAVFVHELVHVWQAQQGVLLPLAKLRAGDSRASYAYALGSRPFAALNIEQQAMVVEHAFRLSRGGRAPYPAEAYAEALPFASGGTMRA